MPPPPRPVEMAPGIWRLGTHHIASFLILGKGEAGLFEVGVSSTARLVLEQLHALDVSPRQVGAVILTHAHSDHAAGQQVLMRAMPNARLLLTEASLKHLQKPQTLIDFIEEDEFTARTLAAREPGTPAPIKPGDLLPRPLETVRAGQPLDIGGVRLELLPAEGHAPGGLAAWLPQTRVLLGSDSLGFVTLGGPGLSMNFVSYSIYRRELADMTALKPRVAAPGHQDWFMGEKALAYLAQADRKMEQIHRQILANAADGEGMAQELFRRYYKDELSIYQAEVILDCCRLLVRRSLEEAA